MGILSPFWWRVTFGAAMHALIVLAGEQMESIGWICRF